MNESLIYNINHRVKHNDIFYILGDFTLCTKLPRVLELFDKIKCTTIRLVPGNHDEEWVKKFKREQEFYTKVKVLRDIEKLRYKDYKFTLSHYPIESWYKPMDPNSFHLHGHSHGRSRIISRRMDVGVDCHEYEPISIEEVIERLKTDVNTNEEAQAKSD